MTDGSRWSRHVFRRVERTQTTWRFRLVLFTAASLAIWFTVPIWTTALGRSLLCESSAAQSDAILVENFDPQYLLFERAEQLRRSGAATRVLVPVKVDGDSGEPNAVMKGTTELMARIARLESMEVVPIRELEPISLNAARDVLQLLKRERIRSVTVVTPLFRSRRSAAVYAAVFAPSGISVRCTPVEGTTGVGNWMRTWHGIQDVTEQWGKLQYYRLYVLPVHTPRPSS